MKIRITDNGGKTIAETSLDNITWKSTGNNFCNIEPVVIQIIAAGMAPLNFVITTEAGYMITRETQLHVPVPRHLSSAVAIMIPSSDLVWMFDDEALLGRPGYNPTGEGDKHGP